MTEDFELIPSITALANRLLLVVVGAENLAGDGEVRNYRNH